MTTETSIDVRCEERWNQLVTTAYRERWTGGRAIAYWKDAQELCRDANLFRMRLGMLYAQGGEVSNAFKARDQLPVGSKERQQLEITINYQKAQESAVVDHRRFAAEYRALSSLFPDWYVSHLSAAQASLDASDFGAALVAADSSTRLVPTAAGFRTKALAAAALGRRSEVIDAGWRATKIYPALEADADLMLSIAEALFSAEDYPAVTGVLRRLNKANPSAKELSRFKELFSHLERALNRGHEQGIR